MIQIFAGDNEQKSREAFIAAIEKYPQAAIFKKDAKETKPEEIELFLTTASLFADQKVLAISNFFSLPKAGLDKIKKVLDRETAAICLFWQDKPLTSVQTHLFPQAKVQTFPLPKTLFATLNAIRPKNAKQFLALYRQTLETEPFELFLYLLKNQLRRQLLSSSSFNADSLKKAYLNLIELDFKNKTGELATPKEIALERVILPLIT